MAPTVFPDDMHTSHSLHEAVVYVMDGKDSACSLPASIAFLALHVGSAAEAALSDPQKALLKRPGEDPTSMLECPPRMSITGYGFSTGALGVCSITKVRQWHVHLALVAMTRMVRIRTSSGATHRTASVCIPRWQVRGSVAARWGLEYGVSSHWRGGDE